MQEERKKRMRIIAIGGGDIRERETEKLDRLILDGTGKERPRVLFVATANGEAGGYITTFRHYYGQYLGAKVEPLMLLKGEPKSYDAILNKVMAADVIYVAGGNTHFLLETWRHFGADRAMAEAMAAGKTLCGLSAGGICWFERGWSDYRVMEGGTDYGMLPCLGLAKGDFCPHYDQNIQHEALYAALARDKRPMICVENRAAVLVDESGYQALCDNGTARVVLRHPDGREQVMADGERFSWMPGRS